MPRVFGWKLEIRYPSLRCTMPGFLSFAIDFMRVSQLLGCVSHNLFFERIMRFKFFSQIIQSMIELGLAGQILIP